MQIDTGFSNWKDGVTKILKHKVCNHRTEARPVLYVLPAQTKDIGKLADISHFFKVWEQEDFAYHLVKCEISVWVGRDFRLEEMEWRTTELHATAPAQS